MIGNMLNSTIVWEYDTITITLYNFIYLRAKKRLLIVSHR